MNLKTSFDPRSNSLNAIRLLLASLVVLTHTWQVGGYGSNLEIQYVGVGAWAVFGFFTISGFLITRSRLSGRSASDFYWARFLRIYPGFFVCLLVVAFAFAPFAALIGPGEYGIMDAIRYVLRNLFLYPPGFGQSGITDTLSSVPYPNVWDSALWTLFYEAACYVLIGVLATIVRGRAFRIVVLVLFVVVSTLALLFYQRMLPAHEVIIATLPMFVAFLAGSVVYLFSEYLSAGFVATLVALAALTAVTYFGYGATLAALPLAYLLIKLSGVLRLQRVGSKYDISYGIYIYGFPVQQTLALLFPDQGISVWLFLALSFAITIPLAFLSSILVEKPVLKLKGRISKIRRPVLLNDSTPDPNGAIEVAP